MNNILKITFITALAFTANKSQALELVKTQPVSKTELIEVAKVNLTESLKLNIITIEPLHKAIRTQVSSSNIKLVKHNQDNVKVATLAE